MKIRLTATQHDFTIFKKTVLFNKYKYKQHTVKCSNKNQNNLVKGVIALPVCIRQNKRIWLQSATACFGWGFIQQISHSPGDQRPYPTQRITGTHKSIGQMASKFGLKTV